MNQHSLTTKECKEEIALMHAETQDMTDEESLKMHAQLAKDLEDPTKAGTPFASKAFTAASAAADDEGGSMINRAVSRYIDVEEDEDGVDHGWKAPDDVRNKHAPPTIRLTPSEVWQRSLAGRIKPTTREAASSRQQPASWPDWQTVAAARELELCSWDGEGLPSAASSSLHK